MAKRSFDLPSDAIHDLTELHDEETKFSEIWSSH
jgi:hypothetical protein